MACLWGHKWRITVAKITPDECGTDVLKRCSKCQELGEDHFDGNWTIDDLNKD